MRILVVDDSVVFRSQIKAALENVPGLEVVGTANNGKIALQKLAQSSVDLVTLDMEMPEMGGLETIKEIRKAKFPVKIIVFSSHTTRGSEAALDALASGAHDFVAKPSGDDINIENAAQKIKAELLPKVLQFLPTAERLRVTEVKTVVVSEKTTTHNFSKRDLEVFKPLAVCIGSSTGGPPALEKALQGLVLPLRVPILIAQHMPPVFTASLAKRLHESTGIPAAEGVHGEEVIANRIYIAPGDFHMSVKKQLDKVVIQLDKGPPRNSVRPAVDTLFESAADVYGHRNMAVVLTGMGEDGLVGARYIKEKQGGVLIQDQASCVVFGMPGAIYNAGIHDGIGNLSEINQLIKKLAE